MVRERRFDLPARGGVMAALEFGPVDRPVDLVFSHANGFNARTYSSVLDPLGAEGLRILAVDLRGHGRTDLPLDLATRRSWDDLKDDLLALLAAAEVEGAVLAGHSMGATVSLLTAAQVEPAPRAVLLFEPVIMPPGRTGVPEDAPLAQGALKRRADFPSRQAAVEAYTGRGAFKTWPARMLEDYVADGFRDAGEGVTLSATPAWEFSNFTRQAHDSAKALAAAPCPVRILKAESGSTCSLGPDDSFGAVSIEVVPGASHFLPMERPDVFASALRQALFV